MNNFKTKILKYAIIPAFIFCMIFLVGCNMSSKNTVNTISHNMNNLINTINSIELLDNNQLIISDFMDGENVTFIELEYIPRNFLKVNSMNSYLTKLSLLNNAIYNTVQTNNKVTNTKMQIIAKGHQIKSLSDQYKESNCSICDNCLTALKESIELISSNLNRIKLTKNEIKNYLTMIEEIKGDYSEKIDLLKAKYEKLDSGLNTRLAHYINILNGLENLEYLLTSADCICNEGVEIKNESKIQENSNSTIPAQTGNKKSFKNIDTYENAGINGYNNRNIYNYNDRYNYQNWNSIPYGYGSYNSYMINRGYGYPQMMPYGFGMGMPFGYGGFTYPNINTYGAYKNIDTYKPSKFPKNAIENDEKNNQAEENIEVKDENISTNTSKKLPRDNSNRKVQTYNNKEISTNIRKENKTQSDGEDKFV